MGTGTALADAEADADVTASATTATRRAALQWPLRLATAAALQACKPAPPLQGGWVGEAAERGHRLRNGGFPAPTLQRRAEVVVVGAGVAGLAAARRFRLRGIDDVHVFELLDDAGGNARGHRMAGMACPLGAHYLPLPDERTREVRDWLFDLGLLRMSAGRAVADERHLCHSPQERLFFAGRWHEGLLPPHDDHPGTLAAYRAFEQALARVQREAGGALAFSLPTHRARIGPVQLALDTQTFAAWLREQGLTDARLAAYLDYCCRDDYGAGIAQVSAWAGLHYFGSRHGFTAPGGDSAERDAVFTWPEGNAWLVRALAQPLGERLHTACAVWRVSEGRHGVEVLLWNAAAQRSEAWTAQSVVLALPLFVAARIVESPPDALRSAALQRRAPWLVANLQLDAPLLDRPGPPLCWDNVIHGSAGLGYVDAMHQSLRPYAGATVLTAYHALPEAQRAELLGRPWSDWADVVLRDLRVAHPDITRRLRRIELTRHGHAMAIPVPGTLALTRPGAALHTLRNQRGRLRFAHADLAGYSVFEEAFVAGDEAASA